jgi:hypothetical protein
MELEGRSFSDSEENDDFYFRIFSVENVLQYKSTHSSNSILNGV